MKTTKLVVGIIMIVVAFFISIQSVMAGMSEAFINSGGHAGTAGLIVEILYLASGIVYIATRGKDNFGPDIASLIMLLIAWIFGLINAGIYKDLIIWSWLAFIIGIVFFAWHKLEDSKK